MLSAKALIIQQLAPNYCSFGGCYQLFSISRDSLVGVLEKALEQVDVLITSGGVSMGEKVSTALCLFDSLDCDVHILWCRIC